MGNNDGLIGVVIILSILGVVGLLAFSLDSQPILSVRDKIESNLPANSKIVTDELGSFIAFYKPPGADMEQQNSDKPLGIKISEDPDALELVQKLCADQNAYFDPDLGSSGSCVSNNTINATSITEDDIDPIDPVFLEVNGISFTRERVKVISSNTNGELPYVNRGEILLIVGLIKLVDVENSPDSKGNPVYLPGPFYYNGEILNPNGSFLYATKPGTKTDSGGQFEISYTTKSNNVLGIYTVQIEVDVSDDNKIINTIQFELR